MQFHFISVRFMGLLFVYTKCQTLLIVLILLISNSSIVFFL